MDAILLFFDRMACERTTNAYNLQTKRVKIGDMETYHELNYYVILTEYRIFLIQMHLHTQASFCKRIIEMNFVTRLPFVKSYEAQRTGGRPLLRIFFFPGVVVASNLFTTCEVLSD